MVEKLPFSEYTIHPNQYIRKFDSQTNPEDLLWHWDEEDRIIESIEFTDWQFQFDNQLPQNFDGEIQIPKGTWHRLIKGSGDLILSIQKIYS